jgi:hypothetical protein
MQPKNESGHPDYIGEVCLEKTYFSYLYLVISKLRFDSLCRNTI